MLLNTMLLLSGGDFFSRWLEGWNLGGLILVLIGAALIIIEMLIPGFGIAGISGAAAVIAGLIIGSNDPISALFSVAILVVILAILGGYFTASYFMKKADREYDMFEDLKEKANATL